MLARLPLRPEIDSFRAPRRDQRLVRTVFVFQPRAELLREFRAIRRHRFELLARRPPRVVLVLQLDHHQPRIVGIAPAGVRIHVLEQLDRHLDVQRLQILEEIDDSVGRPRQKRRPAAALHLVVGQQPVAISRLRTMPENMRPRLIHARALQRRDVIVHPLEQLRLKLRRALPRADPLARPEKLVKPHRVDPELRTPRRAAFRFLT